MFFAVTVVVTLCWPSSCDFVMDGIMYLWLFNAPVFVRMAVFWMLVFARMNVAYLNQPPRFPHAGSSHAQAARFLCEQMRGEVRPVFHKPLTSVPFTYTRDQLLAVSPSPLHLDVVKAIRGVGIGYHRPPVYASIVLDAESSER